MVGLTKDCARGIVLLKLTTDRLETSRGLSTTAELLVVKAIKGGEHRENGIAEIDRSCTVPKTAAKM